MKARLLTLGLFGLALTAPLSAANVTVLTEGFGGLVSDALSGTTADTFDSAITTAGGSATWVASQDFKANGSIVNSANNRSAYLNLGNYINALKGNADAKFILTATITQPTAGSFVSVGFSAGTLTTGTTGTVSSIYSDLTNPASGVAFKGVATSVMNTTDTAGTANYYAGLGQAATFGAPIDPGVLTGPVTFTTTLDFTTAGGYNGTTNFGTATFANSLNSVTGSFIYTSNVAFNGLGFTKDASTVANLSNLSLVQVTASAVPEPATYAALCGLGVLAVAALRRRRQV